MNFRHPDILFIFLPIVAISGFMLLNAMRGNRNHALVQALLRVGVFLCVIVALAAPYRSEPHSVDSLTALLDISGSITEPQGEQLLEKAKALADALSVPLVVAPFAGAAIPRAVKVSPFDSFSSVRAAWQSLDTGSTNIAAALLGHAVADAPLVLALTDGYETVGSVQDTLAHTPNKPVFPLSSTGEESDTTLTISQLHAPRTVPAQRSAEIRTSLSNRSSAAARAQLEVRHGETVVLSRAVQIQPNSDLSVLAQSNAQLEGLQPIQARLSWTDSDGQHSITRSTWLSAEKREKVLLLSGSGDDDRFLSQMLNGQSYQLRSLVLGDIREKHDINASEYETIVLNNVPIDRIPSGLLSELHSYVRKGGGLVVVGGGTSYGLGGYIGSALEELLPVKILPPQPEKKRLTIAVQLVVDKSRSMATDNRLEFAKAAAEEVVRSLKDDDFLGVIGFDEVPFIALPISRLSQVRDTAISRISRLFPTSRTNLFPALDEARRGLVATPAGRKHIIVLTDGKLPDPGRYYFDLIRQMRFVGITVSTVMVGDDADDGFLAQMAQAGGGAFYQTTDPANLPKVFLSDVKVASGERTMRESSEMSVRPGPDPLVSTEVRNYPTLRGFIQTARREQARTELLVRDSEGAHPLLASWDVGDGRVVAFTSDANGRWSSNWMRWERVQEFWSDLVEASRRRETEQAPSRIEFDLRTWVDGGDVVMDLAVFSEVGSRTIHGEIIKPDGFTSSVEFTAEKPGHFRARVSHAAAGTYRAKITLGEGQVSAKARAKELPEVAWDIDASEFGERQHRRPDMKVLAQIANRTGGVIDPEVEDLKVLMHSNREQREYRRELLAAALVLYLFELAFRVVRYRWWV